jgi:ribosomal protein S18 acetylase RimI-like enzyme
MLHVRRASEADVDALVPLKASVHALHVTRRPDVFKAMTHAQVATWLRERLAEETAEVWLAERGAAPSGYLLSIRREWPETPFRLGRRWCEIDEIAVDPSSQRQGVARALVAHVVALAREAGLAGVELTTWAFNEPAQSAFVAMGFEPMIVRYELGGHESAR